MNTWTAQQLLADGANTDPDLLAARHRKSNLDRLDAEFRTELDQHRRQHGSHYRFTGVEDLRARFETGEDVELDAVKTAVEHDRDWHLYATSVGDIISRLREENRQQLTDMRRNETATLTYLREKLNELTQAVRDAGENATVAVRERLVGNYAAIRRAQAALMATVTGGQTTGDPSPAHEARNIHELFPAYDLWIEVGYVIDQQTNERLPIETPWPADSWGRLRWFCDPEVELWIPSTRDTEQRHADFTRESSTAVDMSPSVTEPRRRSGFATSTVDPRTGRAVELGR